MHGGTTLVTGGAGFIGSHLVDALLARGESVIVLDDLSTGQLSNLDRASTNPRFRFVRGSVLDELVVDQLAHECDTIVHLAAAVGVKLVVDHPLRSLHTNIRGAENIIEAAHRHGCKILVASTSEIYGKNASGPLTENSDRILGSPSIMRWAYSTAKVVDEILATAYHRELGLRSIVVRLFNTVGPRQSPAYGMVIPRLVHQALAGQPLTVYGDGQQTRCFAHVADVVAALVALLDEPAAIGETFNIGNSGEISILDLAKRVIEYTGSRSDIVLVPFEEAFGTGFEDMNRRVPDTGKLQALTGWMPLRDLDDALYDIIAEVQRTSGSPSLPAAGLV
ncbi:NAD-dependent epimerase/dehydratase family protein [Planosporangium sp. 12N6]|uniref:NAD-dependent epimerase/dehydratase family protein n=1 Tax=Planosporangium spinosum TaxID=3402278 RepID=UPI003CF0B9A9